MMREGVLRACTSYTRIFCQNLEQTACSCKLMLGFLVAPFEDLLQRSRAFSAQGRSNKITIFIGEIRWSSLPENLFFFFQYNFNKKKLKTPHCFFIIFSLFALALFSPPPLDQIYHFSTPFSFSFQFILLFVFYFRLKIKANSTY